MRLTQDEEKMLSGGHGEATRRAMEILVKMGDYSGAERMVPVSWADLSTFSGIGGGHGDSPDNDLYKFMQELDDLCERENVKFRCPTTLADVGTPERNERLTKMGAQLISPAGASSPHDIFPLPLFGQYVTPGATNINTYCNSMIGARGNNEGPVGVRMAAITGKTPEYGYLLDENRRREGPGRCAGGAEELHRMGRPGFLHIKETEHTLLGRAGPHRHRSCCHHQRRHNVFLRQHEQSRLHHPLPH